MGRMRNPRQDPCAQAPGELRNPSSCCIAKIEIKSQSLALYKLKLTCCLPASYLHCMFCLPCLVVCMSSVVNECSQHVISHVTQTTPGKWQHWLLHVIDYDYSCITQYCFHGLGQSISEKTWLQLWSSQAEVR